MDLSRCAESWNQFVNVVGQRDFARMDYQNKGVGYRVATPGAKIIDGKLHAFIRYQADNWLYH